MISTHVNVSVDLSRVRRNAEEIAARVGVPVWATIKADAYGLGAARVAGTRAGVVEGFCVFALAEAGLLDEPEARLDAVRPGLALYRGAVRTSARLADVRRSAGAIGYGGWRSESGFHGVILAGYSHGLRPGPVMVNGRRQRITEIGMQSAYVTLNEADRMGDEVMLLG